MSSRVLYSQTITGIFPASKYHQPFDSTTVQWVRTEPEIY